MPTHVLTASPDDPREDRLRAAVRVLARGGIVAVPTETFYGLAVNPFDAKAVRRLHACKGKAEGSPVLLLLSDASQIPIVAGPVTGPFASLAERFWPGPLTIVVPAVPAVPVEITGGTGTVGIRVPGLPLPRRLAAMLGRPVTGTSANAHGAPPCRTASEVLRAFPQGIDLVLDGGPTTGGAPSTVVDLSGEGPKVVREGAVPVHALVPFLPGLVTEPPPGGGAPKP